MINFNAQNVRSFIGNTFFFSTVLGIYYFFVFIHFEKIPFPLDSSSLPTIFSTLGILGTMLTGISLFYSSMAIIIVFDPLKINYRQVFYTKPSGVDSPDLSGLINYLIFAVSPLLIALASILNAFPSWVVLACLTVMPSLFSLHVIEKNGGLKLDHSVPENTSKIEKYFEVARSAFGSFLAYFVTFFYLGLFTIASAIMFYTYVNHVFPIDTLLSAIIITIVFLIINYVITLPSRRQSQFEVNAKKYSGRSFLKTFFDLPAAPIYLLGFIFSLTPMVAYKNTIYAFRIINSGGNIERSYYISLKQSGNIPKGIIDVCGENVCLTKKVSVVLDMNDAVYIRGHYMGQDKTLLSLPKKDLQVVVQEIEK